MHSLVLKVWRTPSDKQPSVEEEEEKKKTRQSVGKDLGIKRAKPLNGIPLYVLCRAVQEAWTDSTHSRRDQSHGKPKSPQPLREETQARRRGPEQEEALPALLAL